MGLSLLGDPLGLLACHWLHRYRSETTQGYLRVFRDSVVDALALLGGRPQGPADTSAGGDPVLRLFPVLAGFLLAAQRCKTLGIQESLHRP